MFYLSWFVLWDRRLYPVFKGSDRLAVGHVGAGVAERDVPCAGALCAEPVTARQTGQEVPYSPKKLHYPLSHVPTSAQH